jgi:hypothetical protein
VFEKESFNCMKWGNTKATGWSNNFLCGKEIHSTPPQDTGQGWLLVRYLAPDASIPHWHPSTDQLRGTDEYGEAGNPTND